MSFKRSSLTILTVVATAMVMAAGTGCRAGKGKPADAREKQQNAAFQKQLTSLRSLADGSAKAQAAKELFGHTDENTLNASLPVLLSALRHTLLYSPDDEVGLVSVYDSLQAGTGLSLPNRLRLDLELATYYAHIAHLPDSAGFYLGKIRSSYSELADTLKPGWYSLSAQNYILLSRPQDAVNCFYRAIAGYEANGDSSKATMCYGNMANVYRSMNDHVKASELTRKSLVFFERRGDSSSMLIALQGLAADYTELHIHDSARIFYDAVEGMIHRGIGNPLLAYYVYYSRAGMYVNLKSFDSSRMYFDRARKLLPMLNDPHAELKFTIGSAIPYSQDRDVSREAAIIEGSIPELLADSNFETARDAYFSLYNISLRRQHTKRSSLDYYLAYDSLKTMLADRANREYIADRDARYESQKQSLKIDVQHKELRQKSTFNFLLLVLLLVAALTAGAVFFRMQAVRSRRESGMQRQFTASLLQQTEGERARIASELHDGISHELLDLKNKLHQDRPAVEEKVDHIINEIRLISRALHPVMLDKIGLRHSIQNLCDQLMTNRELFVTADISYDRQLRQESELQLYRIIQEALTNVIKYADALAAKVTILAEGHTVDVTIQDNGKGFNVEETLGSREAFGLHSIIARTKALQGSFSIVSGSTGTVIHILIPVQDGNDRHSR